MFQQHLPDVIMIYYLVIFEEEKGLDEGEDEMEDVYDCEDKTFASCCAVRLKVGGDVKSIQSDTADWESYRKKLGRPNENILY